MALRYTEGFDIYPTVTDVLNRRGGLQWHYNGLFNPTLAAGRYNSTGQSMNFSYSQIVQATLSSNFTEIYVGFGFLLTGTTPFSFGDTATGIQLAFSFNIDGSITHPFGRTVNNTCPQGTWFFFEIGIVVSKTAGRLTMRVNNQPVYDQTGLNTSPQTNQVINFFQFGPTPNLGAMQVDDIYVCDGTTGPGSNPCNTFLGDSRIFTLYPDAAGDLSGWTSSNGSNPNWQQVSTPDGDTNYNSTSTVGAEDLVKLTGLPSNVISVIGVQVIGQLRKTDATAHTATLHIKSGGVDSTLTGFLAPYALTTNYLYYAGDPVTVDPATSATWTLAALLSGVVQIGYKLES